MLGLPEGAKLPWKDGGSGGAGGNGAWGGSRRGLARADSPPQQRTPSGAASMVTPGETTQLGRHEAGFICTFAVDTVALLGEQVAASRQAGRGYGHIAVCERLCLQADMLARSSRRAKRGEGMRASGRTHVNPSHEATAQRLLSSQQHIPHPQTPL